MCDSVTWHDFLLSTCFPRVHHGARSVLMPYFALTLQLGIWKRRNRVFSYNVTVKIFHRKKRSISEVLKVFGKCPFSDPLFACPVWRLKKGWNRWLLCIWFLEGSDGMLWQDIGKASNWPMIDTLQIGSSTTSWSSTFVRPVMWRRCRGITWWIKSWFQDG